MTPAIPHLSHEQALDALKAAYAESLHKNGAPQMLSEDEIKDAMKAAFKELLDEKAKAFGYFSFKWVSFLLVGGAITWVAVHYGISVH